MGLFDELGRLPPGTGGLLSSAGNWFKKQHPLDQAAMATMPIPLLGDVTGLAADARMFAQEPDSRTPLNFGLSALGALPFIPALSIAGRKAKTLNPKTLELAESMKKAGNNRDDIWKQTEFQKAHAIAQKNAALPAKQGGLELTEKNTAMDRAKAMGFDVGTPYFHSSDADISEFNKNISDGFWFTDAKDELEEIGAFGANAIYPSLLRFENSLLNGPNSDIFAMESKGYDAIENLYEYGSDVAVMNNNQIRSINAAFDPKQKDSSNILANMTGLGLTGLLGNQIYQDNQ